MVIPEYKAGVSHCKALATTGIRPASLGIRSSNNQCNSAANPTMTRLPFSKNKWHHHHVSLLWRISYIYWV